MVPLVVASGALSSTAIGLNKDRLLMYMTRDERIKRYLERELRRKNCEFKDGRNSKRNREACLRRLKDGVMYGAMGAAATPFI